MKVRRFAFGLTEGRARNDWKLVCRRSRRRGKERKAPLQVLGMSSIKMSGLAENPSEKSVRLCFNFDGFEKQGFTLLPVLLLWRTLETGPREFARKPWKHP